MWDGNEEQHSGRAEAIADGILLAGGGASAATREMLAAEGPSRIVRELSWLNLKNTELAGMDVVELGARTWSRGGYAFFDTQFPPSLRYWLARPFDRIFFAGEHTSLRWQGYMNGAVETGMRAAERSATASLTAESRGRRDLLEDTSLRLCVSRGDRHGSGTFNG